MVVDKINSHCFKNTDESLTKSVFPLPYRTDKPTPMINKGQPRGPGNYFIWETESDSAGFVEGTFPGRWLALGRVWHPPSATVLPCSGPTQVLSLPNEAWGSSCAPTSVLLITFFKG
jgi:hypothetical protein